MHSQLYQNCKILAIVALIASAITGVMALDRPANPGPAGLCIAAALTLGMSLIAMAILKIGDRRNPPTQ